MGRATQGVRLINLEKRNDEIASVCKVDSEEEALEMEEGAETSVTEVPEENPATGTVDEGSDSENGAPLGGLFEELN